MKASTLKKSQKAQELLENIKDELEKEMENIQGKMDAIEEKADNRKTGNMTVREEEKYDLLKKEKDIIEELIEEIENSIIFELINDLN